MALWSKLSRRVRRLVFRPLTFARSGQMKRDFLLAQGSPQPPPAFATGPPLAARPVSRTASMATEVADAPADPAADDADVVPVLLPNHKEVSKLVSWSGYPMSVDNQTF